MDYEKAIANVYEKRVVCGKCGFRIAEYKIKPEEQTKDGVLTVLCRRRNDEGVPCNTVNEIKV